MPHIINLPKFEDPRGNLTIIEEENHIPFKIKRVYWIYDVPGGQHRGGHAFKEQQELVVALSGSFDVVIDDGKQKQTFSLNQYIGENAMIGAGSVVTKNIPANELWMGNPAKFIRKVEK